MLKRRVKLVTITFIIFVISFMINNNNYAKIMEENTNWKVVITSDTKELSDTREIKFVVEDNKNVVDGKIAPGLKAIAYIEIDFENTSGLADIQVVVDESNIYDCFKLTAKINEEDYDINSIKTIKIDEAKVKQEMVLELEWLGNDNKTDTFIGSNINEIKVPVTIVVSQHV